MGAFVSGRVEENGLHRVFMFYLLLFALAVGIAALATLVAAEVPALEVDSPADGLHTNDPTLHVNGTTEPTIIVRVHVEGEAGETSNSTISREDGTFDILVDLFEGRQNVTVQAEDRAGNTTNVTRSVVLDLTPPELEVFWEFPNGTRVPWNDVLEGYVVREPKVVVNGSYGDDLSGYSNLTLRLNGEPLFIGIGFPGDIYVLFQLEEGLNPLFVDVTDAAGNRATVRLYILLDSTLPDVFIYTPLEGLMTNISTVLVTGLTEPITRLDVVVEASAGTRTYDLVSMADGTFEVPVQLFEGIQKVVVTATDAAGNANTVDHNVILDTTPYVLVILSPEDDPSYTNETSVQIVATTTCDCHYKAFANDIEMEWSKGFRATVPLEEGTNPITVRSLDRVGNEWETVLTVYMDSVPPRLTVTSPTVDSMITNNPTIHFEGWVVDSYRVEVVHKGIDHRVDLTSGDWEDGEWRYDLELTESDLEMDILVRAWDLVGNEDLWSVHVVLDIEPPTLTIDTIDLGYLNRYHFTITGTTSEDVVRVTANGVEGELVNGSFTIIIHHDDIGGSLQIEARDAAGNVNRNHMSPIILDNEPPTFKLDYPRSTDRDRVTIKGTCSDDAVEVWIDQEMAALDDGRFELEVEVPGDGKHKFLVKAIDLTGNTASKNITISKGDETPGLGPVAVLLGFALVAVVTRMGRNRISGAT